MCKQGQIPIRRGRNAPVTLTMTYFMFHCIASSCETGTRILKYSNGEKVTDRG